VAFAGTDPLRIADWISDVSLGPLGLERHVGFEAALDAVWDLLEGKIHVALRERPGARVFLTGHSLGGALAVLAAERCVTSEIPIGAIYTFGMPRVGDARFAERYNERVGDVTFRLAYGQDVVPIMPPSEFGFRHVGRFLYAASGKFEQGQLAASPGSGEVQASAAVIEQVRRVLHPASVPPLFGRIQLWLSAVAGAGIATARGDVFGVLMGALPRPLRDHLPDRYWGALQRE
jgi:hypothetical protein